MSSDDKLVKKPYSAISYTPQMVEELKGCLDPKSGPAYFIENFVQLQHPIRGRIPFTFFDYQQELCEVYHQNRYSVAMVSRQMGKCLTGDTKIRIRNKRTGEIQEISMEEFHSLLSTKYCDGE